MSRALSWFNLAGVAALAVLCVMQWRVNRALNLDINVLEKTGQAQVLKISDQEKNLQGLTADLENFRGQLTRAHNEFRETSSKLLASERETAQLTAERDQLKESIANWTAAVKVRDERITEANDRIREIGERLKESVLKFNSLAARYNGVVRQLDELTIKYNAVAAQASEAKPANVPSGPSP